jgi:hypothetical protein
MPLTIALNTSAKRWGLDDKLHPLDTFSGGILTCPHDGTGGHDTKRTRGTLVPLNSGDPGILHEFHFPLELLHPLGVEINSMCNL